MNVMKSIPRWDKKQPLEKRLGIDSKDRIPATRVTSWKKFQEMLGDELFNRDGVELIYRGQRKSDWALESTLERAFKGEINPEIALKLLDNFKLAIRGRVSDNILLKEDAKDFWTLGQHFGLKTPVLDWTKSPFVALYFAFSKQDSRGEKNPYRAVYLLNFSALKDEQAVDFVEPLQNDNSRLVSQAGLFSFSPIDEGGSLVESILNYLKELDPPIYIDTPEKVAEYILKIFIKNNDREGCLAHLLRMNIHAANLFPDLIGASDYCNAWLEGELRDYNERQRQIQKEADEAKNAEPSTEEPAARVKTLFEKLQQNETSQQEFFDEVSNLLTAEGRSEDDAQSIAQDIMDTLGQEAFTKITNSSLNAANIRRAVKRILRQYNLTKDRIDHVTKQVSDTLKRI